MMIKMSRAITELKEEIKKQKEERELIMLETNLEFLEKALEQKNNLIRTLENTLFNLMKA